MISIQYSSSFAIADRCRCFFFSARVFFYFPIVYRTFIFVFICQNNRFPFGRWNNTTSNPKLYKIIQPNCEVIGQTTNSKLTTNLFPNSTQMTAAQIYTMHANSSGRAQR